MIPHGRDSQQGSARVALESLGACGASTRSFTARAKSANWENAYIVGGG